LEEAHYVAAQNTEPLEIPGFFYSRKVLAEKSLSNETVLPVMSRDYYL